MRLLGLVTVVAVTAALPPLAVAGELSAADKEKAKGHFEAGERAFRLGHFDKALAEFSAGYEITGDPVFLYNLGQVARQKNDLKLALYYYRQMLATDVSEAQKRATRQRIAELEEAVRQQEKAQKSPPTGPVTSPPEASTPAEAKAAPAVAPPTALPPPVSSLDRTTRRRTLIAALTLSAIGVVGTVVGIALLAEAERLVTRADDAPSVAVQDRLFADGLALRPPGYAMLGVGAGALVGGLTSWVLFAVLPKRARYAGVSVTASWVGGPQLVLGGRF